MTRIALRSLAILALFVAADAQAVTLNWNNAAGGSAAAAGNWLPVQVPAAADNLFFNLAGSYTITFNSTVGQSASHTYRTGTVSLAFSSPHVTTSGVTVGSSPGDMPRVTMTSGIFQADKGLTIGGPSSGDARLSVQGSGTLFQGFSSGYDFFVGNNSAGTLNVQTGAIVRSADDLFIGLNATGNGIVNVSGVSGNPSTLSTHGTDGDIVVGQSGTGLLAVSSGGDVEIQRNLEVAMTTGSNGTVTVANSGSKIYVPNRLNLSSNETAAAGAGTGSMTVSGGLVTVGKRTKIGDFDGGSGVLHVTGGTFETDSLIVDTTHGSIDLQSGILRIARGVGSLVNSPFTFQGGTFMLRDTASVSRSGAFFIGETGASLKIRNKASFTCGSNLFMTGGTPSIDLDSSATLNVTGRLNLVAGGTGSLHLNRGSTATVSSFETADETGFASMTIESPMGTTSTLTYQGTSYIGGDETDHASGGTTVFIQSGGEIRHSGSGTTLFLLGPSNTLVNSGGTLTAGDTIYVKGLLQVNSGTISVPVLRFLANGRLQAMGTVPCDLSSAVTTTSILASGNVALGRATTGGWQFGGSLFCGNRTVSIIDTNGFSFGDTTSLAGGSLGWTNTAIVPATGAFIARGSLTGILANNGILSIEGANPATLTMNNNLVLGGTSTLKMRLTGRSAGQADLIQSSANIGCGGTLDLSFTPGAVFQAGDVITILSGATRSGTFNSIVTHGLPLPAAMQVETTSNAVRVHFLQTVDVPVEAPSPLALVGRSFAPGGAGAAFELTLPERAFVTLEVFDARGRRVAVLDAKDEDAGVHRYPLVAAGAAPWGRGVYFGRVRVESAGSATRTLTSKVIVR